MAMVLEKDDERAMHSSYYFDSAEESPCPGAFVGKPWEALSKKDGSSLPKGIRGNIHQTVSMSGDISVGKNTEIGPYAVIEGPATIGEGCVIRPGALIRPGTMIGDRAVVGHCSEIKNCIVFTGAKIASLVFAGDSIIGKGARIGSGTVLGNRRFDQKEIRVKAGTMLQDTGRDKFGCVLGDYSRLGANTTVSPGTLIGKHSWIVGGSLVKGFVPRNVLVSADVKYSMKPKDRVVLSRTDSSGRV